MARLEDLLRGLRAEDLPPDYADLAPILTSIDAALTSIGNAFNGNVTLADNVRVERIDVQLSHGVAQTVRLKKLPKAGSVIGYSCGTDGNGTAHAFVFPPSVSPTSTPNVAQVTAYFKNNAAVRVNCTIWIEPDGQTSSKTPSDTAWTAPTLLNSWANFDASHQQAGYFKDISGFIHLRGLVKSGTVGAGTPIFTLPSGYRPALESRIATASNDAFGWCQITAAGNVAAVIGSNVWFSLDGITFDTRV